MKADTVIINTDQQSAPLPWRRIILTTFLLTVIVYAITLIPYLIGYLQTPEGFVFNGQLIYTSDQNMYYSFIRQAADGHILFTNRLTHIQHNPVFFNLEWLLVGNIMAAFGNSTYFAYEVWRVLGIFTIVLGFSILAELVLQNTIQRVVALLMCIFGGGFGWLIRGLERSGFISHVRYGDFDLWAGFHPFVQMMYNPHFSLPLGLFILFFAAYVKGEKSGRTRWYWMAGIIAVIEGIMRPYDLIALYSIIPLFIIVEIILNPKGQKDRIFQRSLPLFIALPLLLYNFILFSFHPVFKYWGSQGVVWFHLPVYVHFLNTGLAAVLCAVRLSLIKKYPLDNVNRLLLTWLAAVFFLVHAYKFIDFIPYSFQLYTTLLPPFILLGVAVLDHNILTFRVRRIPVGTILLCAFILVNSLSSITATYLISNEMKYDPSKKRSVMQEKHKKHYIPATEMESFAWLDRNGKETDIVLCLEDTGNFIAKYASVRVVMGHWSVTPLIKEMTEKTGRFYAGKMTNEESESLLDELGVQWIYAGQREKKLGNGQLYSLPGLKKCYDQGGITIYAVLFNGNDCDDY